jgi:hypothetical protein
MAGLLDAVLDAVGCSFSYREGSAGPPLKNVMLL